MSDFKRSKAWQRARVATKRIYEVAGTFPRWEDFGLRRQITSAANSMKANLAEGLAREHPKDILRFCRYAMASAKEVESHLTTALDAHYVDPTLFDSLNAELDLVQQTIAALMRRVAQ